MRRALFFLLPALLLAAGCQKNVEIGGQKRPKTYQAIVSLSPSTSEILGSLGVQLKGRTEADNWPNSITRFPVVSSLKPDYEKLAVVKPDLVVFDGSLYNDQDVEKLKALGAEVFTIKADTIATFRDELYQLGSMVGQESMMDTYVIRIETAIEAAAADPLPTSPKVAVLLASSGAAEHMIAGVNSFIADAVRASGGTPVGPESNQFERLSAEFLLKEDPDFLVVGASTVQAELAKQIDSILKDPRLQTTKAVRSRQVLPMNQDVVVRRGYRVDKFVETLHKLLANQVGAK